MNERPPIGLVPAGGRALRLGLLPCSKEILPVGLSRRGDRVRIVCDDLLDALEEAGTERAFVVLGHGKWDVPAYLAARERPELAFVIVRDSPSTAVTVAKAARFVEEETVAFGFPDILFHPRDAFVHLLARLEATSADVVLGLFPAASPEKVDMVERDEAGRVRRIVIKPRETSLDRAWILAVWGPAFTRFTAERALGPSPTRERYLGDVLNEAVEAGLAVDSLDFGPESRFLDVGTIDDFQTALREGSYEA